MVIKCGLCDKNIEVSDNVADGQHIRCPFCGEKSEYRRPSRIELPLGAASQKRVDSRKQSAAPNNDQSPAESPTKSPAKAEEHLAEIPTPKPPEPRPAEPTKPALHVIRDENAPTPHTVITPDGKRRIFMAEEHARFFEELKNIEHRRKMMGKLSSIIMLSALVLAILVTFLIVHIRHEKTRQAELAYMAEKTRLEAERAEQERLERIKYEAEQKAARERREAEEKANAERREAYQRARMEALEAEKARQKAERVKAENELLEAKVLYKKTIALFQDAPFDFVKALPEKKQPGACNGEFYYLLPFLENGEIVVCNSLTNGIASVYRLNAEGAKTPFDAGTFLASLEGKDYLVADESHVYFHSKRKKPHIGQISKREVVELSKEFFGDLYPEVSRIDLDPNGLLFEIVFIPNNSKQVIVSETVEYGAKYTLDKVREAVEEAFPMAATTGVKTKKQRFKRTVVIWDGAHIKRGVDGITYVPRVAPVGNYAGTTVLRGRGWDRSREWKNYEKSVRRAEHTREQWQALYDEAIRQDNAERQFYANHAATQRERAQAALTQAEREYSARIDSIMRAGTLYFRAKLSR